MAKTAVVRVAINAPLSRLFDYLPASDVQPGCRVRVPFGRRKVVGMVMEQAGKTAIPRSKLKTISAVLDDSPLLDDDDLALVNFTSDYYHHPIGEVVAAALPAMLRSGQPLVSTVRKITATAAGRDCDLGALARRAPRQAALLEVIRDADDVSFSDLDEALPGWRRLRKSLADKQLIEEFETAAETDSTETLANVEQTRGPELNADQAAALQAMRSKTGFAAHLLDGVTGSGKTEIYMHLINDVVQAGQQVLVLVPEIGLTPQLVRRFRQRLGLEPVLMHSALSDSERLAAWRAAREGAAPLIVGTRSAVFVPLKSAGLIIVDEEHDISLKQQEGLRYSARDLAIVRAKRKGIPVVLGSATPSFESLQRCREKAYQHLRLPSRAGKAVPPLMRLVDLNRHPSSDGLSVPVISAISNCIRRGEQSLLFLNRRGFAPTLICTGCGRIADCSRCDARMTVHAAKKRLLCHHCGASRDIDVTCADCGNALKPLGEGTERLEEALRDRFPDEMVARIDSDSTRMRGTMHKALVDATSGQSRILVGTQMLAKGHHFPNLTLVIVINADQGLFSTDFRGSERLAQSLIQVAGRAGREARQGEVLIQTAFPQHAFWSALITGGYEQVAESALAEREQTAWPPFSRLALIRASATRQRDAHEFLGLARELAERSEVPEVRVLGPVSAPMERKAGRYRAQLLLQSRGRRPLHGVLRNLRAPLEGHKAARRVRWSIDVDPIELF
ncbi:MAG: primosomal protein N' [Woeseiaceae bacterium]|nr:primosomal protein N' [Woeseiaceae bacterium]